MINSVIKGYGSYLPKKILSNHDLAKIVDTSDDWITSRSGIKFRHIAKENELTSDMATKAAQQCIDNANIDKKNIDLIIVATTTPDDTFPSVAVKVQKNLAINTAAAFDLQAVCAGFVYALSTANSFIKSGQANNILVIGAEKMSSILNWQDRTTCVLFGDGAGAILLCADAAKDGRSGIIDTKLYSDGSLRDILYTNGGVASNQQAGTISMLGKEVFKHAVDKMSSSSAAILAKNNLTIDDIDYFIPHQANIRILEMVAKKLNLPREKLIISLDKHANTSAASIPLAISEHAYKFKAGDLILLEALGGGLCWGACLVRW